MAYTSYQKILTQRRSFFRRVKYDNGAFLSDVRIINDIVRECVPLSDADLTHRIYSIISNTTLLY